MTQKGFDYGTVKYIPKAEKIKKDVWVQEGDFFVSRGNGSLSLVGRGAHAQKPPFRVIFPDTMIRLRFEKNIQRTGWIPTIWPSQAVRQQIEAKAKTTAGIFKVSQPDVTSIVVPVPPEQEQAEIVRRVEALFKLADRIERRVSIAASRADKLTQSILAKAFRGELVPNQVASAESRAAGSIEKSSDASYNQR